MNHIEHITDFYEKSKEKYIEGNLSLVAYFASFVLITSSKELSDYFIFEFLLKYTYLAVNSYKSILSEGLDILKTPIKKKPNDYMCLLMESIILYLLQEIKPAILSMRRSLNVKRKKKSDPLYKLSDLEKRERYESKILEIDWRNITDEILDNQFWQKRNNSKEEGGFSLELLRSKLHESNTNIEKQINILRDILNKKKEYYSREIYQFILDYINFSLLPEVEYGHRYDFFYLLGSCLLRMKSKDYANYSYQYIFSILNDGFDVKTYNNTLIKIKLRNYKEAIIDLINHIEDANERETLALKAISQISNGLTDSLEENKHLYICDVYREIGRYLDSIRSCLKASSFSSEDDKYAHFKYPEKLRKILNKMKDIDETENLLSEILNDRNISCNNLIYSQMCYEIGKKIYLDLERNTFKSKKNEEISKGYELSIRAYEEAIKNSFNENYNAKIFFSRGKAYEKIARLIEAETDFEEALNIDRSNLLKDRDRRLSLYEYRTLLQRLAEINFKQGNQNIVDIPNVLYNEIYYYENCRKEYYSYYSSSFKFNFICKKISEIYYVKGIFLFQKSKMLKSKSGFKHKDFIRSLEQSLGAYREALEQISIVKTEEQDYALDYFKLEIMTGFIMTSSFLLENWDDNKYKIYKNYYKEAKDFLSEGSKLLIQLLDAQKSGKLTKKYKYISSSNLQEKFSIIEAWKITSIADKEEALNLSEIRKNICLMRLLGKGNNYKNQSNTKLYRKLLRQDIAIVYWHIGITEVTSFILSENERTPIEEKIASNYHEYIKFKKAIDKWQSVIKSDFSEESDFPKEIETTLNELYKVLHMDSILKIIEKNELIKNIILIPHRDLHKIPLHIFFCESYNPRNLSLNKNHKKKVFQSSKYDLSYLPSIEFGLQLDENIPPSLDILLIHPSYDENEALLHSYTESTAIYLRAYNASSKVSEILEGDPDSRREKVVHQLKNNISFNCLHFLGHAFHDFKEPKKSALQLTGHKKEKRYLNVGYILKELDFSNYYLVCLSACETGTTTTENPFDEYVGLVSAFLETGVSYVVSTLWKIEDLPTSLFMMEFYRLICSQEHPVIALHKAQIWLRTVTEEQLIDWCQKQVLELSTIYEKMELSEYMKCIIKESIQVINNPYYKTLGLSENIPFKHPYYWGGFIITGLPA
ncbi:hypothetical protein CAL7716_105360 (plasmid) [Calothrix sp. PCC 7716]|nr:hypothetical protein CAL7716_105360 [Calothrix sp. PCC 7716]